MKLSTKGKYAVIALLDMADNYHQAPISLQAIAQRQKLSLAYLEQLFLQLRRANIITSVRGANGGYYFVNDPKNLTIHCIMQATHESFKSTRCDRYNDASCNPLQSGKCRTHQLWVGLENVIEDYLKGITLGHLIQTPTTFFLTHSHSNAHTPSHNEARSL